MLSVGLMKGNSIKSNEIRFDVYGQNNVNGYFTTSVSQTITVTYRDGITVSYTGSGNVYIYRVDGVINGTVKVVFEKPDKITGWFLIRLSNAFPDLSILTNITGISLEIFNNISFDSPYLMAIQTRLTGFTCQRGPDISLATVQNFMKGLNVSNLYFGLLFGTHNRISYDAFLPHLADTLKSFTVRHFYGSLIPDCTSLVNLTSLDFVEFARVVDGGLDGNSVDYLPNSNKLKGVNCLNCNMTNTNVNLFIDKIYAWANTNANNSVNLNIGGNNAAASGTYDGTTDWSGGLPTSPKAKLWHLVNSRSWTITFTA